MDLADKTIIMFSAVPALLAVGVIIRVWGTGRKACAAVILCLAAAWVLMLPVGAAMRSEYGGSRGIFLDFAELVAVEAKNLQAALFLMTVLGTMTAVAALAIAGMGAYTIIFRIRKGAWPASAPDDGKHEGERELLFPNEE